MKRTGNYHIAALIFAQDESFVIGETVAQVVNALGPGDEVFVIADNYTDDTAKIARNAGAQVYIRTLPASAGKGEALAWFLDHQQVLLQPFDFLLVLDADSKVSPNFLAVIRANITQTDAAFQCFVAPQSDEQSPIGNLAALSYFLDQSISDRIRTVLGWPVRLRGTGMLIPPGILIEERDQLRTIVEDIALSLLLTAKGVHISRIEEAIVSDPVPDTTAAASNQRARWFRGQWQAIWQFRREISIILAKGPRGWSLLASLFLKPRWLIFSISLILALVLWRWWWISILFWGYVLNTFFYLGIGLVIIPERQRFIRALFYLPSYGWMWARSIIRSFQASSWLKARERQED